MLAASPDDLAQALEQAELVLARVRPGELSSTTPCEGWVVADVISHMLDTTWKFTSFALAHADRPSAAGIDRPRGDLVQAWSRCRAESASAWEHADVSRTCRLPFGSFPARQAAAINLFDVLVHTWDISTATQREFEPPEQLRVIALSVAERLTTVEAVRSGQYAPAVTDGLQAGSWSTLLRLTGRRP